MVAVSQNRRRVFDGFCTAVYKPLRHDQAQCWPKIFRTAFVLYNESTILLYRNRLFMLSVDRFNLAFLSKRYRCDWDRAELLDHETALDHDIHPVDSLYIVLEGTIFPDNDKAWQSELSENVRRRGEKIEHVASKHCTDLIEQLVI